MPLRPCLTCGKPTSGARCPAHRHVYGRAHAADATRWQPLIDAGLVVCPRCHKIIEPGTRQGMRHGDWQHDHRPDGSSRPAHQWCNVRNWEV
jgi:hypothetical protein